MPNSSNNSLPPLECLQTVRYWVVFVRAFGLPGGILLEELRQLQAEQKGHADHDATAAFEVNLADLCNHLGVSEDDAITGIQRLVETGILLVKGDMPRKPIPDEFHFRVDETRIIAS